MTALESGGRLANAPVGYDASVGRKGSLFLPLGLFDPLWLAFLGTLTAFILVVLITFSTPISTSLYFLHTTQANGVRFGLWGWCLDVDNLCMSPLSLGYTWEPEIPIPITNAFVFYPATLILLVLTLISLIPVLGARDATADCVFRFLGWCAFGSSVFGFLFMIGIWSVAKKRFEQAGFDARYGPLPWLSLVSSLLLLAVVLGSYYFFPPAPVRKVNKRLSTKTSLATMRDVLKRFSRLGQRADVENQLASTKPQEKEKPSNNIDDAKVVVKERTRKKTKERRESRRQPSRAHSNGNGGDIEKGREKAEESPDSARTLTIVDRSRTSAGINLGAQDSIPAATVVSTTAEPEEPRTPTKKRFKPTKSPSVGQSEFSEDFNTPSKEPPKVAIAVKAVNSTARVRRLDGNGKPKSEGPGTQKRKPLPAARPKLLAQTRDQPLEVNKDKDNGK